MTYGLGKYNNIIAHINTIYADGSNKILSKFGAPLKRPQVIPLEASRYLYAVPEVNPLHLCENKK